MSQFISLDQAKKMTALYRANRDQILIEEERGKDILPVCESMDREKIESILAQPGCKGLRIYYGMDPELRVHAIIVGTDSYGRDILPSQEAEAQQSNILDELERCPVNCPPPSPLNP